MVEEVVPNLLSLAEVHKVLANLLRERIPIRDLVLILEALGDWSPYTKDPDLLTEYVRQKLARQIAQLYTDDQGKINCLTLDPRLEQIIAESIQSGEHGHYLAIDPATGQFIIQELAGMLEKKGFLGKQLVVLTSSSIRMYFRKLVERYMPAIPILSFNEIPANVEIESLGMVKINAG